MGNYLNLGNNSYISNDTMIDNYVMMGSNCFNFSQQHNSSRIDIPLV